MENIENLLKICKQLRKCNNLEEVETLKKCLNKSNIQSKEVEKESDQDLCKYGGNEELEVQNAGKSRMLSAADESREVDKLIKEADNLIKEAKELAKKNKFCNMQVKFPTSNLVGDKFESYMHEITDLLTKYKVSTIGVWGMGGVGKTTLIRHLYNLMLTEPHIYGYVYWITVSKDCSIQKLQTDIAKRISETISDILDECQRVGMLLDALKRKKKFVMILDDMWSDYDLNEVRLGIPKEVRYQLIVTSRSEHVCSKMYCDKIIKVDPLSKKDAWTLFIRSIGQEIPDDLKKISIEVLQECGGLPLGIITLAKSMMACNEVYEWSNVLDELRNSSGKVDDMEKKVFNVLRLSYERLTDCEVKQCLLYCATYPEDYDIEINELIWLFIDAELLGKNVSLAKMYDKGLSILRKLERVALLSIRRDPVFKEKECVCLHDLIRDMTLQIAGSRFMIKAGMGLKNIPDEESWTDNIETYSMRIVFDDFFMHLHGLKHLNLSYCRIKTLPKSISLLKSLTALILRYCYSLENVSSLAELSSLERLDFYRASIRELPDIGSLIKLRYLNLCLTRIRRIGVGVISQLIALQYLAINGTFDVKELHSLNNLQYLSAHFEDFVSFFIFIKHMQIKGLPNSYFFLLGNSVSPFLADRSPDFSKKQIYLTNVLSEDTQRESGVSDVLERRRLEIERRVQLFCENEVQQILQDIHLLHISEDECMMSLGYLRRQAEIKGEPRPFSNLKSLRIDDCSNLKKLLPLRLLPDLQNIEDIRVTTCVGLEEFIAEAPHEIKLGINRHPKILSLPKLKRIYLKELPNLKKLCRDDKVIHTPSLRRIEIITCPRLRRMAFDMDTQHPPCPQMIYSKSEKAWLDALEWDPLESKSMIDIKMELIDA